ncbi:MAG: shikimate dehydrogenase [Dehalococcoidia bacterium]|nr:shikimate dehydrogenase [Dehalococcoidia bacterium]
MTRLAGIIGHPVAHSLSPVFQGAAFRASGLDVAYEYWDTPPDALAGRLVSLRAPGYLGANVTIPHKEAVIPLLDELGDQSARVGAVNTIVNRSGRLFGFNTDGGGFVAALRTEASFEPSGRAFLLIGAGGAARGIAFALAEARAARIDIWNRSPERAARLAEAVSAAGAHAAAVPSLDVRRYDCIVNCTSVGMHGGGAEAASPCDFEGARPATLAVDIVYVPERTPFLMEAERYGLRTLGGLPMLIYQGALAFELWTGARAPIEIMFEAARSELHRRQAGGRQ